MSDSVHEHYDQLLLDIFAKHQIYYATMQQFETALYDGFDALNECERQAGLFGPQLNSSSYYGSDVRSSLRVMYKSHQPQDDPEHQADKTADVPELVDVHDHPTVFSTLIEQHMNQRAAYLAQQEEHVRNNTTRGSSLHDDDDDDDDNDEYSFSIADYNALLLEIRKNQEPETVTNDPLHTRDAEDSDDDDHNDETPSTLTKRKDPLASRSVNQDYRIKSTEDDVPEADHQSTSDDKPEIPSQGVETAKHSKPQPTLRSHQRDLSSYIASKPIDIMKLFTISPSLTLQSTQIQWKTIALNALPSLLKAYSDLSRAISVAEQYKNLHQDTLASNP